VPLPPLRRLLPPATLALGAWVALSGIAHIVGSVRVAIAEAKPYDFRYASLMLLGLSLVFAGALQVASFRAMRRGERGAFLVGGGVSLFTVGLVLLMLPILPAVGMLALNVAYLAALALAWPRAPGASAA
jgi:hypothetical protein